jgi:drug/metabolite transporter (DMT)-like permease
MILDRRVLFGILFICGAGILFPVMNGFAKFLGSDYNSIQVSWARAFGHIVFMMATFVPRYGLGMLRTRRPVFQVGRSALLSLSNLSFFFAIVYIPIAEAACISLTAPLVVALLAWPLLGERTTKGRLIALGIGFVGVIVVIRPGTELFHWATLGVVVSATSYALYQIMTRMVATVDTPETSAIYSSIFGSFGLLFVMPFVWKTPETLRDIALFCSLGVLGAMGHYFVARALQLAPANVVTPFQYFQLIGSVVVGYFFFGNFPDVLTWVGAAIIVGAGLYIGWSQTRSPASRAS